MRKDMFIQLEYVDGSPLYLNLWHIVAVGIDDEYEEKDVTKIFTSQDRNYWNRVKGTPAEVMKKIQEVLENG